MPLTPDQIIRALKNHEERQAIAEGITLVNASFDRGVVTGTFEIKFKVNDDVWFVNRTYLVDHLMFQTRMALNVRDFQIDGGTLEIVADDGSPRFSGYRNAREVRVSGHFDRTIEKSTDDRIREAMKQMPWSVHVPKGPFVDPPPGKTIAENIYYVGIDPADKPGNDTFFGVEVRRSTTMPPGTFSIGPIEVKNSSVKAEDVFQRIREQKTAIVKHWRDLPVDSKNPLGVPPHHQIRVRKMSDGDAWWKQYIDESKSAEEAAKFYRERWADRPQPHFQIDEDGTIKSLHPGPQGEPVVGTFRGKPITQHYLDNPEQHPGLKEQLAKIEGMIQQVTPVEIPKYQVELNPADIKETPTYSIGQIYQDDRAISDSIRARMHRAYAESSVARRRESQGRWLFDA